MSTPTSDALPAGASLRNGGFVLGRALGQGGFGITYVGNDAALHRAVAIKEFFPLGSTRAGLDVRPASGTSQAAYDSAKNIFLEEARTLARFAHPNIVDVYTVFEENNSAYMVMEYLKGQSLMQWVQQRGALAENEAIGTIRQVGAALEAVHGQGLLHQDVKPDNVMLCDDGRVVLLDFSLTQKLDVATGHKTVRLSEDTRFGTAGYAPLEQYSRQGRVGTYTDVYALAATLYHLLTGQPPAEATDRAAGMELQDVRALNPRVSSGAAQAITDALAMEPRNRPQTVPDFLARLESGAPGPATIRTAPGRPNGFFEDRDDDDEDNDDGDWERVPRRSRVRVTLPDVEPAPAPMASPVPGCEFDGPLFQVPSTPPPAPYQDPFDGPFQMRRPQIRFIGCGPMGCIMTLVVAFFLLQFIGPILLALLPFLPFFFQ